MSWRDVKARYAAAGGVLQGTEDMVARRVLRAVGLTEGRLFGAERELGLRDDVRDDTTLFERARAVALRLRGKACPSTTFDCGTETALLAEADELAENGVSAFFARVGDGKPVAVVGFAFAGAVYADAIVTPCALRRSSDGRLFMVCDAGDYLKWLYGGDKNGE